MNSFEAGLLQFLKAVAPMAQTLFIHNQRSIAIFNASDELFSAAVDQATAQQAQKSAQVPAQVPAQPIATETVGPAAYVGVTQ